MVATARNDPRYVFLWLAAAYLGAIHVAVDPRQTATELDGLLGQVQARLLVTDAELPELFAGTGELDGPGPAEPKDRPPAVVRASLTRSSIARTGSDALISRTSGDIAMSVTGMKSVRGS